MKLPIHSATASVLIAAGSAALHPASAEPMHPVMVMTHDPALGEELRRSTSACVERAQAGRFEEALHFCNLAVRYSERGAPGASVDPSFTAAAARTNRAVVRWLLGRDQRAAMDLAEAATLAPEASFVRRNLAVMGREPQATTLAGGGVAD